MSSEKLTQVISKGVSQLQDVDYHVGVDARRVTFAVITDWRNAGIPDEDIEVLVQDATGLKPHTIRSYMKQEESLADKKAALTEKYGLVQRKRIVPALPDGHGDSEKE